MQLLTALVDQLYGTITLNRTKEMTFHDCFEYKGRKCLFFGYLAHKRPRIAFINQQLPGGAERISSFTNSRFVGNMQVISQTF